MVCGILNIRGLVFPFNQVDLCSFFKINRALCIDIFETIASDLLFAGITIGLYVVNGEHYCEKWRMLLEELAGFSHPTTRPCLAVSNAAEDTTKIQHQPIFLHLTLVMLLVFPPLLQVQDWVISAFSIFLSYHVFWVLEY